MKYIPLTQGKKAIVDDADYPYLIKYKWQYNQGYAKRGVNTVRMSRSILGAFSFQEVDHVNGNKLDNRRSNLRICSRGENNRNVRMRKDSKNLYKGIIYIKSRNRWRSRIQADGKRITVGYFLTPEDAARKYDKLAKIYHGEYSRLNFPY